MIEEFEGAQLVEMVAARVAHWPEWKRQVHGFDLLVGTPTELAVRRRRHARTLLVASAALEQLAGRIDEPLILMKGPEVAELYPSALHRPFRDLDVLVRDPERHWNDAVSLGYRASPRRRYDIDHHHLPPLAHPAGGIGIEFHIRPNVPSWMNFGSDIVFDNLEPSRLSVPNVHRPSDDLHAILLAAHCWKGGFTRLRDLLDAFLLASSAGAMQTETLERLGLERFWRVTTMIADSELLGHRTRSARLIVAALRLHHPSRTQQRFSRVLAPYLVAGPARVTRAHLADYRLGQAARARPV